MKLNVYSIFDTASGLYSRPFFDQADAAAKRAFGGLVQDAEHPLGQHPEDYSLFRLGIFDDVTGTLHDEHNECLVTGMESLSSAQNLDASRISKLRNFQSEISKIENGSDPFDHDPLTSPGGTA